LAVNPLLSEESRGFDAGLRTLCSYLASGLKRLRPGGMLEYSTIPLFHQDDKGQVWLSYNDPNYLAQRHGLTECAEVIKKVENALANIAKAATMP
jgi:hypothetical protein